MILAVGGGIKLENTVNGDAEGAIGRGDGRRTVLHRDSSGRRGRGCRGGGNRCRGRRGGNRHAKLRLEGIQLRLLRIDLGLHGVNLGLDLRRHLGQGGTTQTQGQGGDTGATGQGEGPVCPAVGVRHGGLPENRLYVSAIPVRWLMNRTGRSLPVRRNGADLPKGVNKKYFRLTV